MQLNCSGKRSGGQAPDPVYYASYSTSYGNGAVVSSPAGLVEVLLPFGSSSGRAIKEVTQRYPDADCGGHAEVAARELERYFRGERIEFTAPIDFSGLSAFARRVCEQVRQLGYGEVRTYGWVAAAAGLPRAFRAVGAVMAANRLPIVIPCHRVVAVDGSMRGYSAAGGVETKKLLLTMERVRFSSSGERVFRIA